jgi:tripartite-type tricarboxylate transporter receptor subunit TctC
MTAALKAPEVVEGLKSRGIDSAPNSPAEFAAFIRAESVKWRPVVLQSGIKPDGI